jgi:hypothetical protein
LTLNYAAVYYLGYAGKEIVALDRALRNIPYLANLITVALAMQQSITVHPHGLVVYLPIQMAKTHFSRFKELAPRATFPSC